jgi:hypothetical protein
MQGGQICSKTTRKQYMKGLPGVGIMAILK